MLYMKSFLFEFLRLYFISFYFTSRSDKVSELLMLLLLLYVMRANAMHITQTITIPTMIKHPAKIGQLNPEQLIDPSYQAPFGQGLHSFAPALSLNVCTGQVEQDVAPDVEE